MSSYDHTLKILLLGDSSLEKSAVVKRYCYNIDSTSERLTIGADFHVKTIECQGKKIKLQIWTVGGEERFRFLLPTYCLDANGVLLLYDITQPQTLENIGEWITTVRQKGGSIPIVLVGTNLDLSETQRQVSRDYGIQVAEENGLDSFIEISTKTGQYVDKIFEKVTDLILKRMEESDYIRSPTEDKEMKEQHFKKKSVKLSKRTLDHLESSLEFLKKYFLRRTKGDIEGDVEDPPNPYIYNPPEPPDDIAPALQAQRKIPKRKLEPQTGFDCPYCGFKLSKGQKYCPICGKDL